MPRRCRLSLVGLALRPSLRHRRGRVVLPHAAQADAASQDAKYRSKIAAETTADDASPLIAKLRAQTAANAEKNALAIEMKNFENSQAGDFGPMRRFYPVKKRDGTFVILTQVWSRTRARAPASQDSLPAPVGLGMARRSEAAAPRGGA